jgi:alanine-alpha-ketoisovalerate/valine-pyruvate aminotransferase
MQIRAAHLRHQGIDFAVFGADALTHFNGDRADLLNRLVANARADLGWRIEEAALAFMEGGQVRFYGTPDLVKFLLSSGLPAWTHTITLP